MPRSCAQAYSALSSSRHSISVTSSTASAPNDRPAMICRSSTMKSFIMTGRLQLERTMARYSSLPAKYSGSVRHETAEAPSLSYSRAITSGASFTPSIPSAGVAYFTSAMTAMPGESRAAFKDRTGGPASVGAASSSARRRDSPYIFSRKSLLMPWPCSGLPVPCRCEEHHGPWLRRPSDPRYHPPP